MNQTTPNCPKCNKPMVKRVARSGERKGQAFWGCQDWKSRNTGCNGLINIEDADNSHAINDNEAENQPTDSPNETSQAPRPKTLRPFVAKTHSEDYQLLTFDSTGVIDIISGQNPRTWGMEIPAVPSVASELNRTVSATLRKLLNRGRHILLEPDLEKHLSDHQTELDELLAAINIDSFNPEVFEYDSAEEKECYSKFIDGLSFQSQVFCPQVFIESMADEFRGTNQRVDFYARTPEGNIVIEYDGAHHQDSAQATIDSQRDAAIKEQGIATHRITSLNSIDEVRKLLAPSNDSINTAAHFAHTINVMICEALARGLLPLQKSDWSISFHLTNKNQLLTDLIDQTISSLITTIAHLETLYTGDKGVDRKSKITVNDIENEEADLHLHFQPFTTQGPELNHFFYRDYPSDQAVPRQIPLVPDANLYPDDDACHYFLKYLFRFEDFREGQLEAVQRGLQGKDVIALLPTGHGKSAIYQLIAFLRPGICLVIDPIISLMDDQVENLKNAGISRVASISGQVDDFTKVSIQNQFATAQFDYFFISPERLQIPEFRDSLKSLVSQTKISAIVVDEAHCISEWGHDFRPAYLRIADNAREHCASFGGQVPPVIGLTGTASRAVLKDIKRELRIDDFDAIITPSSFDRPELSHKVVVCRSDQKDSALKGIMNSLPAEFGLTREQFFRPNGANTCSGIVFCPHVNGDFGVHKVANDLRAEFGVETGYYSGSAPRYHNQGNWNLYKQNTQRAFKDNSISILAATKAFGMGIDKPNVRYTIHYNLPSSIENYYQEAGRSGRDRNPSQCVILASNDFEQRNRNLLSTGVAIKDVDQAVKDAGFKEADDIIRSLFFQTNNFKGLEEELADVEQVILQCENLDKEEIVDIDYDRNDNATVKAVHRLSVLGLFKDYENDYSHNLIKARTVPVNPETIREQLFNYIANYQQSMAEALIAKIPESLDNGPVSFLMDAARALLEFTYSTIELSRRRALLEVVEMCSKNATDVDIRNRIIAYLGKSEFDEALEELVKDMDNIEAVDEIMEEIVSVSQAKALRGPVGSWLESYPNHPVLLQLRGWVECMSSDSQENSELVVASFKQWAETCESQHGRKLVSLRKVFSRLIKSIRAKDENLAYQILKAILEFADEPFCDWYETQEISLPEKIILSVKTIKTYESELSEPLNKIARLAQ